MLFLFEATFFFFIYFFYFYFILDFIVVFKLIFFSWLEVCFSGNFDFSYCFDKLFGNVFGVIWCRSVFVFLLSFAEMDVDLYFFLLNFLMVSKLTFSVFGTIFCFFEYIGFFFFIFFAVLYTFFYFFLVFFFYCGDFLETFVYVSVSFSPISLYISALNDAVGFFCRLFSFLFEFFVVKAFFILTLQLICNLLRIFVFYIMIFIYLLLFCSYLIDLFFSCMWSEIKSFIELVDLFTGGALSDLIESIFSFLKKLIEDLFAFFECPDEDWLSCLIRLIIRILLKIYGFLVFWYYGMIEYLMLWVNLILDILEFIVKVFTFIVVKVFKFIVRVLEFSAKMFFIVFVVPLLTVDRLNRLFVFSLELFLRFDLLGFNLLIFYLIFFFFFFCFICLLNLYYNFKFKNYNLFFYFQYFFILVFLILVFFFFVYYVYVYYNFYRFFKFSNLKLFYFNFDTFGFVLFLLSVYIGFISGLVLLNKNKYFIFIFFYFIVITYYIVISVNVLKIFFFYECLLLPSFLLTYFLGYNQRILNSSIIFLIWTQMGSFIVLAGITYIYLIADTVNYFELLEFEFLPNEGRLVFFLLFLGFGVKIPIWPFHFWLTKIHVEATTGFSIFLSGFLVKTAAFCFYRFIKILQIADVGFGYILICIIGVADASIKIWGQVDLKKIIAYSTVQEMNLIYLLLLLNSLYLYYLVCFFLVIHAVVSTLLFYCIELIYKRFLTRSVLKLRNVSLLTPNLYKVVLLVIFLYLGLPISYKFIIEFNVFYIVYVYDAYVFLIIIFSLLILNSIGFFKNFIFILYSHSGGVEEGLYLDLHKFEYFVLFFNIIFLLISPLR